MKNLSVGTLKTTSETLEFFKYMLEWSQEIQMAYAWGSSANEKAPHWQFFSINKVTKAVIGIHFAQTEPIVLRKLSGIPNILKVVDDTSGVFHPKVIIGIKNGKAKAIIGSSNFTKGGFAGNTEFNISLQGILKSKIFIDIVNFIKDQWNSPRAFIPDDDWLDRYTTAYNKRPNLPSPTFALFLS